MISRVNILFTGLCVVFILLNLTTVTATATLFGCDRGKGLTEAELDEIFGRKCRNFIDELDFSSVGFLVVDGTTFLTKSASECCAKCRQTSGCRSWTWYSQDAKQRPQNGCWLSTASARKAVGIKRTTGVKSGIVGPFVPPANASGGSFSVALVSVPYNEPKLLEAKDDKECERYCREEINVCRGWSFNNENGQCKLVFDITKRDLCNSCASDSVKTQRDDSEIVMQIIADSCETSKSVSGTEGIVFDGKPVISAKTDLRAESSSECCQTCARIRECRSWNYKKKEKTCEFFGDVPPETKQGDDDLDSSGVIVPKVCPGDAKFDVRQGVNLTPSERGNAPENALFFDTVNAEDSSLCGQRCAELPSCRAWTFFPQNSRCSMTDNPDLVVQKCDECVAAVFADRYATPEDKQLLERIENEIRKLETTSESPQATESEVHGLSEPAVGQETKGASSSAGLIFGLIAIALVLLFCFIPLLSTFKKFQQERKIREERKRIAAAGPSSIPTDLTESPVATGPSSEGQSKSPLIRASPSSAEIAETSGSLIYEHVAPDHKAPPLMTGTNVAELREILQKSRQKGSFFEYNADPVTEDMADNILDKVLELEEGAVVAHKYRIEAGTRIGQNSAIVKARLKHGDVPVVLKFFKNRNEFEREYTFYSRTIASNFFPDVKDAFDEEASTDLKLPSMNCLVLERGDMALDEWFGKQTSMIDPMDQRNILYKISRAVQFLHENRIVHRDLKPGNIVVFTAGLFSLKLIDLGSARQRGEKASVEYTLRYAAPELILAHLNRSTDVIASPSSDMWSLGLIFWEIIVGEPLLGIKYPEEEVMSMLAGLSPLPFEGAPQMWSQISDVVARRLVQNLLVRNPDERWPIQKVLGNAYFSTGHDTVSQQTQLKVVSGQLQSVLEGISRIEQNIALLQEVSIQNLKLNAAQCLIACISFTEIDPVELQAESVTEEYIISRYQRRQLKCTEAHLEPDYNIFIKRTEEPVALLRVLRRHLIHITLMTATDMKTDLPVSEIVSVSIWPTDLQEDAMRMRFYATNTEPHCMAGVVVWDTPRHRDLALHVPGRVSMDMEITVRLVGSNELVRMQKTVFARMHSESARFRTVRSFKMATALYLQFPNWVKVYIHGAVLVAKLAR